MAEKSIQIKQHNGTDWDSLFPKTKAKITMMDDGTTVESTMAEIIISLASKLNLDEVNAEIKKVVGAAPAALDTLQELSIALNNDPDFATNITNSLSNKVDKVLGKQLSTEDFSTSLKNKLASGVYTKQEVDNKISESTTGIPVSTNEPTNAELWFQVL
ncbi:hypothetical protein F0342_12790 [Bacillus sp. CH30_1T]|uniref:hypothetical protein n=1 Tax=Bacillus sp. CH30_1T TaxID=2604836 RepID=UPI0011ECBD93|nr:hypothetical protein [Bacillus sp. CH30_1T]KAA0563676.1 hypothetical protein F0342_12790 [Bacillus sp. CH30_1T]